MRNRALNDRSGGGPALTWAQVFRYMTRRLAPTGGVLDHRAGHGLAISSRAGGPPPGLSSISLPVSPFSWRSRASGTLHRRAIRQRCQIVAAPLAGDRPRPSSSGWRDPGICRCGSWRGVRGVHIAETSDTRSHPRRQEDMVGRSGHLVLSGIGSGDAGTNTPSPRLPRTGYLAREQSGSGRHRGGSLKLSVRNRCVVRTGASIRP